MSVLTAPLLTRPSAPLARRNPLAKLAAAVVVMVGLLLTVDLVTPGIVLGVELVALAWAGLSPRRLLARLWLLLAAAGGLALSTLLLTDERGGALLVPVGPVEITTDSITVSIAVAARVLGIAVASVLATATIDPTDLGDALVQQLRASPRFVFGALGAFRMLPLLADEWNTLRLAARARGLDPGRSPVGHVRQFTRTVFALLVAAIRRGVRLATAMEARGFADGGDTRRTIVRPQRMTLADWALIAGTGVLVVAATAISMVVGSWSFLLGLDS